MHFYIFHSFHSEMIILILMTLVVSHLFLFLGDKFRGRCDSHESHLPLCGTIYFPTAPFAFQGVPILICPCPFWNLPLS